jgi:hypothetical protein
MQEADSLDIILQRPTEPKVGEPFAQFDDKHEHNNPWNAVWNSSKPDLVYWDRVHSLAVFGEHWL